MGFPTGIRSCAVELHLWMFIMLAAFLRFRRVMIHTANLLSGELDGPGALTQAFQSMNIETRKRTCPQAAAS